MERIVLCYSHTIIYANYATISGAINVAFITANVGTHNDPNNTNAYIPTN